MAGRAFGVVDGGQASSAASRPLGRRDRVLCRVAWNAASELLLEPAGIASNRVDIGERLAHGVSDGADRRIANVGEPVEHPQAITPSVDEARAAQIRQMPRRLRLRNVQALVDMADADFTAQQEPQDAKPGRIPERLK
jgi:hypothetical protein